MSATPLTLISVAVVEHQGRFLVGRRPPDAPLAGLWEFPGGKVQPGESPAAAAIRECREETGLVVGVCGEYPAVEHEYPHGRLRLRFFACRVLEGGSQPRGGFEWAARAALMGYEFPEANQALLAQLTAAPGCA